MNRYGAGVRLRVLSVREPWASEIMSGKKTVELRSYSISPGPLGIASTASGGRSGRLLCIVDVVDTIQKGDPWLVEQGVRREPRPTDDVVDRSRSRIRKLYDDLRFTARSCRLMSRYLKAT